MIETMVEQAPMPVLEPMGTPLPECTMADYARVAAKITWTWPGWLPNGMVTMLAAEQGLGKSNVALFLAQVCAFGGAWPDGQTAVPRGQTVWLETEAAMALHRERAERWGGEAFLHAVRLPQEDPLAETRLDDAEHLANLRRLLFEPAVALLVIDSLSGGHLRDENSGEAGQIVRSLAYLAEETGKPVVVVHHLGKNRFLNPVVTLDRVRGHTSITQYARTLWALDAPDPGDREALRLSVIKNNMIRLPDPLGMRITDRGLTFSRHAPTPPELQSELETAEIFLKTCLGNGQQVAVKEVEEEAEAQGIERRTLRRAKIKLGVKSGKDRFDGQWFWSLPR
jgi:putative DNA primase/helicase